MRRSEEGRPLPNPHLKSKGLHLRHTTLHDATPPPACGPSCAGRERIGRTRRPWSHQRSTDYPDFLSRSSGPSRGSKQRRIYDAIQPCLGLCSSQLQTPTIHLLAGPWLAMAECVQQELAALPKCCPAPTCWHRLFLLKTSPKPQPRVPEVLLTREWS